MCLSHIYHTAYTSSHAIHVWSTHVQTTITIRNHSSDNCKQKRPIQAHIFTHKSQAQKTQPIVCPIIRNALSVSIINTNGLYKLTFVFTRVKLKGLNQSLTNDCTIWQVHLTNLSHVFTYTQKNVHKFLHVVKNMKKHYMIM